MSKITLIIFTVDCKDMKIKLIILITSFILSHHAYAEWHQVAEGKNAVVYIELKSIKKNKGKIRFWTLYDLKTPTMGALSFKSLQENDCNNDVYRVETDIYFSENMGGGSVVINAPYDDLKWKPVVPDSVNETVSIYICNKK